MIVTSCTAAQRCANSSNKNTYTMITYRVSDEDFDNLFTDAVVTMSSIHCLILCATYQTNTYYDTTTRRCSCQELCASYSPVSTGSNHVEKYYIPGKVLKIHSIMTIFSSLWTNIKMCKFLTTFHYFSISSFTENVTTRRRLDHYSEKS